MHATHLLQSFVQDVVVVVVFYFCLFRFFFFGGVGSFQSSPPPSRLCTLEECEECAGGSELIQLFFDAPSSQPSPAELRHPVSMKALLIPRVCHYMTTKCCSCGYVRVDVCAGELEAEWEKMFPMQEELNRVNRPKGKVIIRLYDRMPRAWAWLD